MLTPRVQTVKQTSFDYEVFEPVLSARVAKELSKTDYLHTLQVVKNMKRYVHMEGGKFDILVTAAYLHEVGKGDNTIVLSHELDGKSSTLQKCAINATKALEILKEVNFPEEKSAAVQTYLAKGECFELKRAHHVHY